MLVYFPYDQDNLRILLMTDDVSTFDIFLSYFRTDLTNLYVEQNKTLSFQQHHLKDVMRNHEHITISIGTFTSKHVPETNIHLLKSYSLVIEKEYQLKVSDSSTRQTRSKRASVRYCFK